MLSVFIADDEAWVVESLKASVPWEQAGFTVIGQSHDGIDAYEQIGRLTPDVVFTDIRMPGMNGLELLKKAARELPGIAFIVISGFAEFAYAQKALNYGAVGFCLKPFDEEEILLLLKKVRQVRDHQAPVPTGEGTRTFLSTDSCDLNRADACQENDFEEQVEQLEEAVKRGDIGSVEEYLFRFRGKFISGQWSMKCAATLYNRIVYLCARKNCDGGSDYLYNYEAFVQKFNDIHTMLECLLKMVRDCMSCITPELPEDIDNRTFKAVLKYVHENFFRELSVQSLSVKFFISPNYLSQLFKKSLNTTFTDYLTGIRIRYACRLLETEELHVNEVGQKAGYPDYFYFSRVFKKMTGKTPTQYRDEMKTILTGG